MLDTQPVSTPAPWPTTSTSMFDGTLVYTKDPTDLTRLLKAMLIISIITTALSIVSQLMESQLIGSGNVTLEAAEANDLRQRIIGIIDVVVYLITAVAFLMWIYRANVNVRGFGAEGLEYTPGWSIGYYFIPFLNWVRPYRAMREIWLASDDPNEGLKKDDPSILKLWWGLFLVTGFLGQIAFRVSANIDNYADYSASVFFTVASDVTEIALCLVAYKVVATIFRMQEELVGESI